MSSMHTIDQFKNLGIQELSFDDIDAVAGAPGWFVLLVPPVIAFVAGVAASRSSDDCTTETWSHTHRDGTVHTIEKKVCN